MNSANSSQWLQLAFNDPVLDAQTSFRSALKALAEPGLLQPLDRALPLDTLHPATYALCLAFLDADTPLWLAPNFDSPAVRANLSFHCGCPIVEAREQALFALLDESELGNLADFDNGSERYPDQSCTLLVQLESLSGGVELGWRGPGIKDLRQVSLPVDTRFWQQRQSRIAFPRGLDVFFAAAEQVIGLPRSTHVLDKTEEAA